MNSWYPTNSCGQISLLIVVSHDYFLNLMNFFSCVVLVKRFPIILSLLDHLNFSLPNLIKSLIWKKMCLVLFMVNYCPWYSSIIGLSLSWSKILPRCKIVSFTLWLRSLENNSSRQYFESCHPPQQFKIHLNS